MGRTPVHIARLSVTEDGGWEKRRVRMRILRERACPGQLGKQQPEREAAAFSCRSQLNSAAAPWSHLGCRPLTACALAGCGRSVVDPGASSRRLPPPLDGPPGTFFLVLWTPRESNRLETDERSPGLRRGSLPASTRSLAGLVQREGTPGRAREPAPKLIASEFVDRRSHPPAPLALLSSSLYRFPPARYTWRERHRNFRCRTFSARQVVSSESVQQQRF